MYVFKINQGTMTFKITYKLQYNKDGTQEMASGIWGPISLSNTRFLIINEQNNNNKMIQLCHSIC